MAGERSFPEMIRALRDWVRSYVSANGGGINAYPIGSIYMSINDVDPATIFGGTWEKIADGTFLMASGNTHAVGTTGGEAEHTLSVDEMPSHNHSGSLSGATAASAGSHSHSGSLSGSMGDAGTHSHERGTMDITGSFYNKKNCYDDSSASGAITRSRGNNFEWQGTNSQNQDYTVFNFKAANNWTGKTSSTGSHSHSLSGVKVSVSSGGSHTHSVSGSVSIGSTGGGNAHNNLPPYLAVNIWKRVA